MTFGTAIGGPEPHDRVARRARRVGQDVAMRAVCVIGLGLIGGSVLRAATAAGRPAWGATAGDDDAAGARGDGHRVERTEEALRLAAEQDALVVVATPLTAVRAVLRDIAWHAPEVRLTAVSYTHLTLPTNREV